jgi:hypothetical protein
MKLACLVKQLPRRGDAIRFSETTESVRRCGVPPEVNAFEDEVVA